MGCSGLGVYLGQSPNHTRSVALVLNLRTGHVSPQFHVKFDDFVETVQAKSTDLDTPDPEWKYLSGFATKKGTAKTVAKGDFDGLLPHDEVQVLLRARRESPPGTNNHNLPMPLDNNSDEHNQPTRCSSSNALAVAGNPGSNGPTNTKWQCTHHLGVQDANDNHITTMEAEYIAISTILREVIPLMGILKEARENGLQVQDIPSKVHCTMFEDNSGALELARLPKTRPRTKHINESFHHFRGHVKQLEIIVNATSTDRQMADILTKPLNEAAFVQHRRSILGW